jgi:DNA-binding LytR/AlgR family response regulator
MTRPSDLTPGPLRALVVDDEPAARDELAFLLGEAGGVEVVATARNAPEALAAAERTQPDVAFVDLRMPGPDGVALAEALLRREPDLAVVVVSAHDDGALRAFDACVLDYLLKPVRLERLVRSLERVRDHGRSRQGLRRGQVAGTGGVTSGDVTDGAAAVLGAGASHAASQGGAGSANTDGVEPTPLRRLAVRRKGVYVVVDIADVLYFETRDDLVWAVTRDDRFALDLTLAAVEQGVSDQDFFRSHRGVLVRLSAITAIEPAGAGIFELVLDHPDRVRVPLARERVRVLRERIPFTG